MQSILARVYLLWHVDYVFQLLLWFFGSFDNLPHFGLFYSCTFFIGPAFQRSLWRPILIIANKSKNRKGFLHDLTCDGILFPQKQFLNNCFIAFAVLWRFFVGEKKVIKAFFIFNGNSHFVAFEQQFFMRFLSNFIH